MNGGYIYFFLTKRKLIKFEDDTFPKRFSDKKLLVPIIEEFQNYLKIKKILKDENSDFICEIKYPVLIYSSKYELEELKKTKEEEDEEEKKYIYESLYLGFVMKKYEHQFESEKKPEKIFLTNNFNQVDKINREIISSNINDFMNFFEIKKNSFKYTKNKAQISQIKNLFKKIKNSKNMDPQIILSPSDDFKNDLNKALLLDENKFINLKTQLDNIIHIFQDKEIHLPDLKPDNLLVTEDEKLIIIDLESVIFYKNKSKVNIFQTGGVTDIYYSILDFLNKSIASGNEKNIYIFDEIQYTYGTIDNSKTLSTKKKELICNDIKSLYIKNKEKIKIETILKFSQNIKMNYCLFQLLFKRKPYFLKKKKINKNKNNFVKIIQYISEHLEILVTKNLFETIDFSDLDLIKKVYKQIGKNTF